MNTIIFKTKMESDMGQFVPVEYAWINVTGRIRNNKIIANTFS